MAAPNREQIADETILAKTGRTRAEWHAILDAFDCAKHGHKASAKHLMEAHGVTAWYAQSLTVDYERARGIREVGKRSDGKYGVSVTRTLPIDVAALWDAWAEVVAPELPEPHRTSPRERLQYRCADHTPPSEILVEFRDKGAMKATIAVSHDRLPDREACERMRDLWRARLERVAGRGVRVP